VKVHPGSKVPVDAVVVQVCLGQPVRRTDTQSAAHSLTPAHILSGCDTVGRVDGHGGSQACQQGTAAVHLPITVTHSSTDSLTLQRPGVQVLGGTTNLTGLIWIKVERVSELRVSVYLVPSHAHTHTHTHTHTHIHIHTQVAGESTVAATFRLVEEAQASQAPIQRIADKVCVCLFVCLSVCLVDPPPPSRRSQVSSYPSSWAVL